MKGCFAHVQNAQRLLLDPESSQRRHSNHKKSQFVTTPSVPFVDLLSPTTHTSKQARTHGHNPASIEFLRAIFFVLLLLSKSLSNSALAIIMTVRHNALLTHTRATISTTTTTTTPQDCVLPTMRCVEEIPKAAVSTAAEPLSLSAIPLNCMLPDFDGRRTQWHLMPRMSPKRHVATDLDSSSLLGFCPITDEVFSGTEREARDDDESPPFMTVATTTTPVVVATPKPSKRI